MPYTVKDLGSITPTSSGSSVSKAWGHLDDATSITIYLTSSAGTQSTGANGLQIQVSQFDPADNFPLVGVTQSSQFYTASTGALSTNGAIAISNISFRGLRLTGLTSAVNNEVIAFASKQVSV